MDTNTAADANTVTIAGIVPLWTPRDRLRKSREVTGLSQEEFAHDLGVSRGTVKNYERGATKAYSRPVLLAWAMRSGVPLEWLLTGQESAPHPSESDEGQVVRRQGLEPRTRCVEAISWLTGVGEVDELAERRARKAAAAAPGEKVPA